MGSKSGSSWVGVGSRVGSRVGWGEGFGVSGPGAGGGASPEIAMSAQPTKTCVRRRVDGVEGNVFSDAASELRC